MLMIAKKGEWEAVEEGSTSAAVHKFFCNQQEFSNQYNFAININQYVIIIMKRENERQWRKAQRLLPFTNSFAINNAATATAPGQRVSNRYYSCNILQPGVNINISTAEWRARLQTKELADQEEVKTYIWATIQIIGRAVTAGTRYSVQTATQWDPKQTVTEASMVSTQTSWSTKNLGQAGNHPC